MQAYVRGLKEPLGSRIRCMRPETIEKALEFVQEELNVIYLQHRNELASDRRPPNLTQPTSKVPYLGSSNFMPKNYNLPSPGPSWQRPLPAPVHNFQPWRPNVAFQQTPQRTLNQPTRTQQMFRAPPPNYVNNGFRIPHRNAPPQNSGPKPMSGVSHFVSKPLPPRIPGHDWQRFGNPPPSNYLKAKEVNFNETYDDYNYYYPDYYYDQYYTDYTDSYNDYYDYDYQNITHTPYEYPYEADSQDYNPSSNNNLEPPQPSTSQKEQDFTKNPRDSKPR